MLLVTSPSFGGYQDMNGIAHINEHQKGYVLGLVLKLIKPLRPPSTAVSAPLWVALHVFPIRLVTLSMTHKSNINEDSV